MNKKLKIGVVGISFGMEFVAIYKKHPDVASVVIADTDERLLKIAQEKFGFREDECFTDIQPMLDDPEVDAIHIVTPPATHAELSIRVLNAGKHCGCTIPMGMSLDELYAVIEARKKSGKQYMFLETTVFGREFFYVQDLYQKGELGKIQYMSCAHYQDMEGWPSYWEGYPPLMHPTHAIGPCLMLLGQYPSAVYARGSGKVRDNLKEKYGCPYAFEAAMISLEDSDVTIEVERFLYGVARSYSECFRVYGENKSFEWQQLADESPVLYTRTGELQQDMIDLDSDPERFNRGSEIVEQRIQIPDYGYRLPEEIAGFTTETIYNDENMHLSFKQGGGHGGSHPHMVHEFVRSVIENRKPIVDDILGAYWTGLGICAHQSALAGGKVIEIPRFKELDS
ncbi:Gfo/Idh/MocA family protein [Faecalicatena contorta]|uniref:Gfo/Idh/MocA family protein n=1 Tax=Faecalicatena contorta TaxID=39482 RepID=UPI001F48EFF4|nr:Gfo/Idh/MocA family oxidoreductase [Faecalicatena contorta]MCF2682796.1 Gfo/Idh/MocA family oxidoreductase [Faecalicatena contorta]